MTGPDIAVQDTIVENGERTPDTKAKHMTIAVLDAGILPHSTKERNHAYKLLGPAYRISGGKGYVENVSRLKNPHVIIDRPPQISQRAELGYADPIVEAERQRIAQEQRDKVMTKVADHMMDYVEDANETIDALYNLDLSIGDSYPGQAPLGVLLVDPRPEIRRAIATLARLHETKEYTKNESTQEGHIDTNLVKLTDETEQRIADATRDLTIGETRKAITEALRLEIGRMEFWTDQLFGHSSHPSRPIPLGDTEDYDEPAVAVEKRHGVIAVDNPILRARVLWRMTLIELGGMVTTSEDKIIN